MKKILYFVFGLLFIALNVMLILTPDRDEYGNAVSLMEYWMPDTNAVND